MNLPVASYRVSEGKSPCCKDFLALPCSKLQGIIKFTSCPEWDILARNRWSRWFIFWFRPGLSTKSKGGEGSRIPLSRLWDTPCEW